MEQLSIALDDANDDKKTLRRKHMANVKVSASSLKPQWLPECRPIVNPV